MSVQGKAFSSCCAFIIFQTTFLSRRLWRRRQDSCSIDQGNTDIDCLPRFSLLFSAEKQGVAIMNQILGVIVLEWSRRGLKWSFAEKSSRFCIASYEQYILMKAADARQHLQQFPDPLWKQSINLIAYSVVLETM